MPTTCWRVMRILGPLFFALTLLLAGCSVPGPTPTLVPEATRTPKPTFTPYPTDTALPTATPLPRSTATLTPMPTLTLPLATATMDVAVNPLTGLRADNPGNLRRRALAVRVGNDPSIRPQEGLGAADIVYEEIMEGWMVTRYTAIYLGQDAERIRPIRSARLVSLSIAPQYDAALVHSGASDRIRWLIGQASFVDLDQYFHPEPYAVLEGYDWRGRMYTSVGAVHDYLRANGLERDESIEGYAFDVVVPGGMPATSIIIPYPDVVEWRYDEVTGLYARQLDGTVHTDGLTGAPLVAANVIVLYAEHNKTDIVEDSLGSTAIDIDLSGGGTAVLYRDGVSVEARWKPTGENGLLRYYDDRGDEIALKPGKTWIQLVPPDYEVASGA